MKTIARCFAVMSLIAAPCASATTYSAVYVFGDSLVDSGNAYLGTGGAQASLANGYFFGRFSNGLNFADYLSLALTTPSSPTLAALAGGTNYAVGGADAQTKPGQASPSFLTQINTYYGTTPIASDALVLVTFGGNDVRDTIGVGGTIDFSAASADFLAGLNTLYELGARNFVITGSPDIGVLPVSIVATGGDPVRLAELTERSEQISALFAEDAAILDAESGTNVTYFDLFSYEQALVADPAAFGLPASLDTAHPCQILGGGIPQTSNCANSLYFDYIHPTTQVHQAIAGAILGALAADHAVPEPAAWMTMLLGFGVIGTALRRGRGWVVRAVPAAA